MNKDKTNGSVSERIIKIILPETDSYIEKGEVEEKIRLIIFLLTDKQKSNLLKKVRRCNLYFQKTKSGMDEKMIRSIMKRKHDINRQHLDLVCKPCKEWLEFRRMNFNKK